VDSAVRREGQVLNFGLVISCRTRSDVLGMYGSLNEPLHATRHFLRFTVPCTESFFF
jgi:hypothetical protein